MFANDGSKLVWGDLEAHDLDGLQTLGARGKADELVNVGKQRSALLRGAKRVNLNAKDEEKERMECFDSRIEGQDEFAGQLTRRGSIYLDGVLCFVTTRDDDVGIVLLL